EASRRRDFFQTVERMFYPLRPGDPPEEIRQQVFYQVYKPMISVANEQEPLYKMSAGNINSLISLYRLHAGVDEPFARFFFRPPTGPSEGSPLVTPEGLDEGVDLFVKIAHWGFGSCLHAFQVLGKERNLESALLTFPLKELGHYEERKTAIR